MAKLNARKLRQLVLETVEEIKNEKKVPSRKQELLSIVKEAIDSSFNYKNLSGNPETIDEDAKAGNVDPERFPLELSAAAAKADKAEMLVTGGDNDGEETDDTVQAKQGSKSVKTLKPSQSSMDINKATAFAIAAILKNDPFPEGPGGDLGAIITSDDHIMDGHHRWIATGMVDPTAEVGGFIVEFPAKQMIAALNMITVKLGITKGKSGSGGFDQFNEAGILAQLEKFAVEGVWSAGGDPNEVMKALEEFSGETGDAAIAASAKKMGENVGLLTLSVPEGFPARPDMPVISKKKGHLKTAIDLLRSGQVDLNEPYASGIPKVSESKEKSTNIILERWNTLAGLLK